MRRSALYLTALCSFLLALICESPAAALAENTDLPILIVELQTASTESIHDKFVAVYNPNDHAIDVTGWQLQYRSASATGDVPWHTKAKLDCELDDVVANQTCRVMLGSHDKLWMASYDLGPDRPSHDLSGGLASKGGQIRFIKPAQDDQPEIIQDMLGYGNAQTSAGDSPAPAPPKGGSLKRRIDSGDHYVSTNNNAADFEATDMMPAPDLVTTPPPEVQSVPKVYSRVEITELFPRPRSGTADKFIELFNPTDATIDLSGYVLQTGSNWNHHHTLQGATIAGHSYLALKAAQIRLALSQRGGGVRLLDPNGQVVSEVTYPAALPGQSWIKTDAGDWQWTTEPTPGAPNVLRAPEVDDASSTKAASAAAATASRKKASGRRASTKTAEQQSKTTGSKAKKKSVASSAKTNNGQTAQVAAQSNQPPAKPNANYWFIGAAALVAGGYALYEYRQDVANLWLRVRGKLAQRSKSVASDA